MKQKNSSVILGIILGILLLVFLGAVLYLKVELLGNTENKDVNQNVEYITNPGAELDPFITHVPKEYFEQNKEGGKIFVSSADPGQGSLGGRVELIAFLSFNDEESKKIYELFDDLLEKYPEEVKIFWKDFYNSDEAKTDAIAAHCAGEQNKFWEYTKALMQDEDFKGLDEQSFEECLSSGEIESVVNSNYFYGRSLEIKTAPVLYINNEQFTGEITLESLDNYINNEISTE